MTTRTTSGGSPASPALADLDPEEFRHFLDTVTAEDFAQEAEGEDEPEAANARKLALGQVEHQSDEALQALARQRPAVGLLELRDQRPLTLRVDSVQSELRLQPPQLVDQPEPLVHGLDEPPVVGGNGFPELVESELQLVAEGDAERRARRVEDAVQHDPG